MQEKSAFWRVLRKARRTFRKQFNIASRRRWSICEPAAKSRKEKTNSCFYKGGWLQKRVKPWKWNSRFKGGKKEELTFWKTESIVGRTNLRNLGFRETSGSKNSEIKDNNYGERELKYSLGKINTNEQ